VLIDWTRAFDQQFDRMEADQTPDGQRRFDLLVALLDVLSELDAPPDDESASLRRVRQSRNHTVWRVAHPYVPGIAVRLVCWFPPGEDTVVVTLFAGDKAGMGDVFYDNVGVRSDQTIDQWLRERKETR